MKLYNLVTVEEFYMTEESCLPFVTKVNLYDIVTKKLLCKNWQSYVKTQYDN